MDDVTILIRRSGDAFAVTVEPRQDGIDDRAATTHRQAYGFASGLRLTHRWRIVDLASDAGPTETLGGAA